MVPTHRRRSRLLLRARSLTGRRRALPNQLLPGVGEDLDPITRTWLRGLILTSLEQRIVGLCWHIEGNQDGALATGYVTMSQLHNAASIREAWAIELDLRALADHPGGYAGSAGALTVYLPNEIDPDEHCRVCGTPFDPLDMRPDGHGTEDSEVCRSCQATSRLQHPYSRPLDQQPLVNPPDAPLRPGDERFRDLVSGRELDRDCGLPSALAEDASTEVDGFRQSITSGSDTPRPLHRRGAADGPE